MAGVAQGSEVRPRAGLGVRAGGGVVGREGGWGCTRRSGFKRVEAGKRSRSKEGAPTRLGRRGARPLGNASVWVGLGVRVGSGEEDLERFTGGFLRVFWSPDGVHQGYPRAHWRVCPHPLWERREAPQPHSACFCP